VACPYNNRRMREATVLKYARDMAAGRWQITGESVKFDTDGRLLDGQQRLAAIACSGVTIQLIVMRGIPAAAQRVMDTGRARTSSDALTMQGEANSSLLAATCRLALGVDANIPDFDRYEATHAEIEQYVADHPNLRGACEFARNVARRTDCAPSVVAYTFYVLAQIDRQAAVAFWTSAADKVDLSVGDPVIALTNRFAEARRNREHLVKRTLLSLTYRAWNARRAGRTMRFIRVNSPAGGLVPIPDPH